MATIPAPRQRLHDEAARLRNLQADMDPTGAAYERLGQEIDDVLAQIWELGPVDV